MTLKVKIMESTQKDSVEVLDWVEMGSNQSESKSLRFIIDSISNMSIN